MNGCFKGMTALLSDLRSAIQRRPERRKHVTVRLDHDLRNPAADALHGEIMAHPVFRDPEAEKEFTRKGYVVRPFLEKHEIDAAQSLHDSLTPRIPRDLYQSVSGDSTYRQQVSDGIRNIIQGRLKEFLPEYRISFCSFVTKRPASTNGSLPVHIDPWFSDNRRHRSVHVWCPLIDVDRNNGCLKVVAGSHRLRNTPFTVTMNPTPFDHLRTQLDRDFASYIPMAAGESIFYDGRLLHASGENRSPRPRVALAALNRHDTAKPCVFLWDKGEPTRFDILEVNEEFLCNVQFMAAVSKPYPSGVRYLESAHFQSEPWQQQDLDELRRLQTEIAMNP
jgi:phytanoyl-CoA dioxygenase PhyH